MCWKLQNIWLQGFEQKNLNITMYYARNTMEIVTFKLQEEILKKIDSLLKPLHFNNRTEFIREAVREKLKKIETEKFMKKLAKFKGSAKTHVSDERLHEIRDEVAKEYAKKFGVDLD